MKTKHYLFGALAAMMMVTSCQDDAALMGNVGETATVSFQLETPAIATRAYSDGTTATVLQYAVYDENGVILPDLTKTDATINISTKVNLQLTTGNTYSVIFWAAAPNAPYAVNFDTKTMTVDYAEAVSNDENRDAFYKLHKFTVKGTQSETVELRRPFAQLNIGTSDYAASTTAGYTPTQSSVTVRNIYKSLNLATGAVDSATAVEYKLADIKRGEDYPFPVDGYEYIAMNYLLMDTDKELIDVEFTYTDGADAKTRTVGSVPVQRNHRTNIYGQLLTSSVDINVEIKPEYDEPAYNLYHVVVDGVSYDDLATAIAKAMEIGKPVEFIENVAIDADNTITIPAGESVTLNLNGYTLSGVTDDADKNDDGKFTSADNEVMFDVRGTMNVNDGIITIKHTDDDFEWNACTEIFYVGFNGTLNVKNATLENYGGASMAYVIDMVNAAKENGITVHVDNSILKSSYIPVRVFNNGQGMNNVTITNSTLQGTSRAFWVHMYTKVDDANFFDKGNDTNGNSYKDETLNIDIYNPKCNNIFIANKPERIIEYGFTDAINFREDGSQIFNLLPVYYDEAETEVVEGVGMIDDKTFAVFSANGMRWFSDQVSGTSATRTSFKLYPVNGNTVMLLDDIDLSESNWDPIGDNRTEKAFTGTFDGQNHLIKGAHITGEHCFNGSIYGSKEGWGLFSLVDGATIKNLKVDNATFASYTVITGTIAGYASNSTFENIDISNATISTYNWYSGGVVGWAANECSFKNINLDSTVSIGTLWGSHDTPSGGIVGGIGTSAKISIEDCNIACVIDAINDVAGNYQWYAYRYTGMIVGNIATTQNIDGKTYPDPSANVTCKNVTVTYGDWMNYHYCEYESLGKPSYSEPDEWKFGRVEASDYATDGIDHTQCSHDTDESHYLLLPFDQLFGGGQGVSGLREYDGVTVNYPASYNPNN